MTREGKGLVRGIALALASVARGPPGNGLIEMVLRDAGIDQAVMEEAEVPQYDIEALMPALRRNAAKREGKRTGP